jgi:drug/metabolite transporter (DMT)-like permease
MPPTPRTSIVFFLVAAFLGALGQFLYKSGAERATGSVASYLLNARLLGGVVCYVAVMVLFVAAFKRGGSLAVLYPLYATTFIWAAAINWWVYDEPIGLVNVAGMALLVGGMFLMGVRPANGYQKDRSVSARPDLDSPNDVNCRVPPRRGPDGPSGPTFARHQVRP